MQGKAGLKSAVIIFYLPDSCLLSNLELGFGNKVYPQTFIHRLLHSES